MKAVKLLLLMISVGAVAFAQDEPSTQVYSLDDCINYALEHNETIKTATLEIDIADTEVREVMAEGFPQINADLGFTHNLSIQTSFIGDFISPVTYQVLTNEGLLQPTTLPDSPPLPVQFGTNYTGRAGLTVSQLIFNGSYFVGLKAASTFKELSTKENVRTQIDIVEEVSKAYYLVLVSQEGLELIAKNYNRLDSLLRETQLLYENGFAEKIDVNRVKVEFNNTKTNLKTATERLKVSVALLKFQMGMGIGQPLQLRDELSEIKVELEKPVLEENFDYNQRIEYSILNTNVALVHLDMKNNRVQYLPNVFAEFNAGFTSGTSQFSSLWEFNSDTWFDYSNWGITMNVPIFDGLRKSSRIQKNKIQLAQLDQNFRQLKNNIDLEIYNAKVNLSNSQEILITQAENMELAEEVFQVTKVKYEEGVGSNLEVVEADTQFKQAQTNYYNALYDALIAKVELQKAQGILLN